MLKTNDLLVKCLRCGAWPMAVRVQRSMVAQSEVSFRCSRCGSKELGRLRNAAGPDLGTRRLDAA
jgi:DNA-directed RNA polymerase subunit RPC12/RpoP